MVVPCGFWEFPDVAKIHGLACDRHSFASFARLVLLTCHRGTVILQRDAPETLTRFSGPDGFGPAWIFENLRMVSLGRYTVNHDLILVHVAQSVQHRLSPLIVYRVVLQGGPVFVVCLRHLRVFGELEAAARLG